MTSFDDAMTKNHVLKETKRTCLPCEFMYARMQGCESMHAWLGNLSQCMPECGEGLCKILLALWATWFIFAVVVVLHVTIAVQIISLTQQTCIVLPQ
jgi:hypothetical protein